MAHGINPRYGVFGLGLALLAVLIVFASQIASYLNHTPALSPWILGAALVYLVGGILTVGAYAPLRANKALLALRVIRILFAAGVIVSLVRTIGA